MPSSRLILASASPRRRELLAGAGVAFEVIASGLPEPERRPEGASPAAWATALAYFKARSVADSHAEGIVLGADTVVVVGGQVLGKPRDEADARAMLTRQAGVASEVITGVALLGGEFPRRLVHVSTLVWMREDRSAREAYLASGDWRGKAGAYGIQDVGDALVERIEGSFTNVVGLPMERVQNLLESVRDFFRIR